MRAAERMFVMAVILMILVAILLLLSMASIAHGQAPDPTQEPVVLTLQLVADEIIKLQRTLGFVVGVHDSNVKVFNKKLSGFETRIRALERELIEKEREEMLRGDESKA